MLGRKVYEAQLNGNNTQQIQMTGTIADGSYLLTVQTPDSRYTIRFVVKR